MYSTVCPQCDKEYSTTVDKICIARTGMCVQCNFDKLSEEGRWEAEGGTAI